MTKSQDTRQELLEAIQRIIAGATVRIPSNRKLSVKAVEDEANLGDGTAYYYQDVVEKIKQLKYQPDVGNSDRQLLEVSQQKRKVSKERKLKEKYKSQIKLLQQRLSDMAAIHNSLALHNQELSQLIREYEYEIQQLKAVAKFKG